MEIYQEIQQRVEEAVGRINGRFSRLDWTPIRYLFRALPFEEVLTLYAVADVGWITPLRDGLNLVAKEYVAVRDSLDAPGVLVLSDFAGAAAELHGALLTNPYDPREMATTLFRALTMLDPERVGRMDRLASIVRRYDVEAWGEEFLAAAGGAARGGPLDGPPVPLPFPEHGHTFAAS